MSRQLVEQDVFAGGIVAGLARIKKPWRHRYGL